MSNGKQDVGETLEWKELMHASHCTKTFTPTIVLKSQDNSARWEVGSQLHRLKARFRKVALPRIRQKNERAWNEMQVCPT